MGEGEYVDSLIGEYQTILAQRALKNTNSEYDESEILKELMVSADWNISAAREILRLVEDYGAFMLRMRWRLRSYLARKTVPQVFESATAVRATLSKVWNTKLGEIVKS